MKKEKKFCKCRYCNKEGKLNGYIIADDMENLKFYHKECIEKLKIEALAALYKIKD